MITLISTGNLTKDALINTVGGKKVMNFTVAHNSKYGDKETVTYLDCAYWNESEKLAAFLKKGQQVAVSGEPSIRTWEKDGKSGASLTLRVSQVQLLGGKSEGQQQAPQSQQQQPQSYKPVVFPVDDNPDDLPF